MPVPNLRMLLMILNGVPPFAFTLRHASTEACAVPLCPSTHASGAFVGTWTDGGCLHVSRNISWTSWRLPTPYLYNILYSTPLKSGAVRITNNAPHSNMHQMDLPRAFQDPPPMLQMQTSESSRSAQQRRGAAQSCLVGGQKSDPLAPSIQALSAQPAHQTVVAMAMAMVMVRATV